MKLPTLVAVFLRLLVIEAFLTIAIQMAPFISQMIDPAFVPGIGVVVFVSVALVLLWKFALPLSCVICRGLSAEIDLRGLRVFDCYLIAFIVTGLFLCASHLAAILSWGHYIMKMAGTGGDLWKEQVDFYAAFQEGFPFIVGLAVLLQAKKWARFLTRRDVEPEAAPNGGGLRKTRTMSPTIRHR